MEEMLQAKKILVIHQGALGDLILSLPAFSAIRKAFPEHHAEVMGYPRILRLIHNRFYAHSIQSIDRASAASLYNESGDADSDIKEYVRQFETVFVFGGKPQEALVKNIQAVCAVKIYRIQPFPEKTKKHVADFQLDQLEGFGFEVCRGFPELFLCEEDISDARQLLRQAGIPLDAARLLAVHPGSGSKKKNWPAGNYVSLIKRLGNALQAYFLIIEGPAEEEMMQELHKELSATQALFIRHLELPLLAAVIKQAALYIGNDSGITHLAAAAGAPALALFGPTDPEVWGPRGEKVSILRGRDERQSWTWAGVDEVEQKARLLSGA